jgi:hypothetical protein
MKKIENMLHVKRALKVFYNAVGVAFDPNTSFYDYKFAGVATHYCFDAAKASKLDLMVSQCFIVCEENKANFFELCFYELRDRRTPMLHIVKKRRGR